MPLSRPLPTLADYRSRLAILALWVSDLEKLAVDPVRLQAEARAIGEDLRGCAKLLGPDQAPALEAAPRRPTPSASVPSARAWGARYVLEGSRLGARVLYRNLAQRMAPHPLAYLSGAGWTPGDTWGAFLGELRRHLQTEAQIAMACHGAKGAFALLLRRCTAHSGVS
jgi:heme oxygenase